MISIWVLFNIFILCVLALDLFVFHRKPHEVSFKEALIWSGLWIALALLFNLYIYHAMGQEAALNFLTGYLIEKSLSLDNLFVFLLIFKYFKTPATSLHKVLFWGILGAIITRAAFIFLGLTVVEIFHPIIYAFGLFLIFTGVKLWMGKGREIDPEKNLLIRGFRKCFPVTADYTQDRFFIIEHSKIVLTPLFLVLIAIESTDILFAIDSIPAILAITFDPFIVYTSNIFAILGLRSLFFLLVKSLNQFTYLHYGISTILIFVGLKMLLADFWTLSPLWSLGIILLILLISLLLSTKSSTK
jgi:tellurite resistance protein TerC